jgi:methyl coenzyme M reductase gamma subunit
MIVSTGETDHGQNVAKRKERQLPQRGVILEGELFDDPSALFLGLQIHGHAFAVVNHRLVLD